MRNHASPSSSSSGPPRKNTRTYSTAIVPITASVMIGVGAPNASTETAIATAIMANGKVKATASQRSDTRRSENPSSKRCSVPAPALAARISAAIVGPAIATMFNTAPSGVSMLIDPATIATQITQEIANVSATNATMRLDITISSLSPRGGAPGRRGSGRG